MEPKSFTSKNMARFLSSIVILMLLAYPSFPAELGLVDEDEGAVLEQLKREWNANGAMINQWQNTQHYCNWTGVSCDQQSHAILGLKLPSMGISGKIPDAIGKLRKLQTMDLADNFFTGTLPSTLLNCSSLQTLNLSDNSLAGSLSGNIDLLRELRFVNLSMNQFSGRISAGFGRMSKLQLLYLDNNQLSGTIPSFLGNLSTLTELGLGNNNLGRGLMPPELGNLAKLTFLWIKGCGLFGDIPRWLGNLTNLSHLDLSKNHLTGPIPGELTRLPKLAIIYLYKNSLSGPIPANISSLRNLVEIDISTNSFNGTIPAGIGDLSKLTFLGLHENDLSGPIPLSFGRLTQLNLLRMWTNSFSGTLPSKIGGPLLTEIDVASNKLQGPVPANLCKGRNLRHLFLFDNQFRGTFPRDLGNCRSLVKLFVDDNQLSGEFPSEIWGLPLLQKLSLENNNFHGQIPSKLSPDFLEVDISNNNFSGSIPDTVGQLYNINEFNASLNNLSGSIPAAIVKLKNLTSLDLSDNMLSGELPGTIPGWKNLAYLDLSYNAITGEIPQALASLIDLRVILLNNNRLSGEIPTDLAKMTFESLNLSQNDFSGLLPAQLNTVALQASFLGNKELCSEGRQGPVKLRPCKSHHYGGMPVVAIWAIVVVFLLVSCALVLALFWHIYPRNYSNKSDPEIQNPRQFQWKMVTFCPIKFSEMDIVCALTNENIIGSGGSGVVYKVVLPDGDTLAVKQIKFGNRDATLVGKELEAEIELSAKIRHANIVRILCSISCHDSALLVHDFMQNGSVYEMLHDPNKINLINHRRLDIAIDAARGLYYLHHGCSPPVIHRDVKSTNILLDSELKAYIADFGLARKFYAQNGNKELVSVIAGSYGYIAPEYASTLKINEKIDIFGFGVVLLELATGRQPHGSEFGYEGSLASWAREMRGDDEQILLDPRISDYYRPEMMSMLKIACLCTSSAPDDRPAMKDVLELLRQCIPIEQRPSKTSVFGRKTTTMV